MPRVKIGLVLLALLAWTTCTAEPRSSSADSVTTALEYARELEARLVEAETALRMQERECVFKQDSLNYEIRYLRVVNEAQRDSRAWYDSLLFGFVVGAGVTTMLVWGLKSL